MRIPKHYSLLGLFLAATVVPILGCGGAGKPINVKGVVTLDGQPLPGATVSFLPIRGGHAATGRTEADGSFRLTTFRTDDGALPGEYKVIVVVVEGDEAMMRADMSDPDTVEKVMLKNAMQQKNKKKKAALEKKPPSPVPAIYSNVKTTPLKETVPPPGKMEIALRSGPR